MREINELKYKREKDEMGDFIINGSLTIEELYFLAKKEGFEKNELYFKIMEENRGISTIYTDKVLRFGRGWSRGSAMFVIEHKLEEQYDSCSGG